MSLLHKFHIVSHLFYDNINVKLKSKNRLSNNSAFIVEAFSSSRIIMIEVELIVGPGNFRWSRCPTWPTTDLTQYTYSIFV